MSEAIGINYQSQYINERITVAEEGQSCSTQFHEGREKNTYCQPLPPPDQGEQDNTVLQQEDSLCAK